jgi:hypothetical protein
LPPYKPHSPTTAEREGGVWVASARCR